MIHAPLRQVTTDWRVRLWRGPWGNALFEAPVIAALILALFVYWFAIADRYAVFLYGHTTVGIPPAQPFDAITASRYWMTGLVASGVVLVLRTTLLWMAGRLAAWRGRSFAPAAWWRVWVMSAPALAIGIPAMTMTVNAPTLPLSLAAACVLATWSGLAVALLPGAWAAARPRDLLWLALDGLGFAPALLLLRVIELPGRGVSVPQPVAWAIALGGLGLGALWLVGMSVLRHRRGHDAPPAWTVFMAGVGFCYVLLPLVHHLFATPPGFRYISTASNFFAFDLRLQAMALVVAAGMAGGVTRLRRSALR